MNPNVGYYVYYINAVTVQITNDYAQVYNPITFGLGVSFVAQCGGYSPTLG